MRGVSAISHLLGVSFGKFREDGRHPTLWVRSRHLRCKKACPLYPRKRMCGAARDVRFGPKADSFTTAKVLYSIASSATFALGRHSLSWGLGKPAEFSEKLQFRASAVFRSTSPFSTRGLSFLGTSGRLFSCYWYILTSLRSPSRMSRFASRERAAPEVCDTGRVPWTHSR
jgi:hypothetical protein